MALDDDELAAAELALMAAQVAGRLPLGAAISVRVNDTIVPVFTEAAKLVARLPKPAVCSPDATEVTAIEVVCRQATGDTLQAHQALVQYYRERGGGLGVGPFSPKAEVNVLLVLPDRQELILPLQLIIRWRTEYVLPTGTALSGRPPHEHEAARGVSWVLLLNAIEQLGAPPF